MTEVLAVTTWFSNPGWSTAHKLELVAGPDETDFWVTFCGRPYRCATGDPTQAPDTLPRCRHCVRTRP